MIQQNLQLASRLDIPGTIKVLDLLRALHGVDGVQTVSGANVVEVRYDPDITSTQEMHTLLARAGFPARAGMHAGSACCGSCGG